MRSKGNTDIRSMMNQPFKYKAAISYIIMREASLTLLSSIISRSSVRMAVLKFTKISSKKAIFRTESK
jgi:hypothetical protein